MKRVPHLTPDQLALSIMDQLAGLVDFYDTKATRDLSEVAAAAYDAASGTASGGAASEHHHLHRRAVRWTRASGARS